jgi:dihydrofolate reductase
MTLRMTKTGAAHYRRMMDETGAIVVGRKLFDFTQGWGGQHPLGCPVVVLTHNPPAVDRPGPGAARWRNPVVPRRARCASSA